MDSRVVPAFALVVRIEADVNVSPPVMRSDWVVNEEGEVSPDRCAAHVWSGASAARVAESLKEAQGVHLPGRAVFFMAAEARKPAWMREPTSKDWRAEALNSGIE